MMRWAGGLALGVVVLAVVAVTMAYWLSGRETAPLDAEARARLGGDYIRLSDGVTHYKWAGPIDGPVVVFIHGGTVPHWTWELHVPGMVKAGFRVLLYDLYGRGYSDRVAAPHDRALYARQLGDLLDGLQVRGRPHLVATSFGGAIAAHFVAQNPRRAGSLVLVAPMVNSVEIPIVKLLKLPVIGPVLLRLVGIPAFEKRARAFFALGPEPERYGQLYAEQFTWEGTEQVFLSILKTDAMGDYRPDYRKAGAGGRRVLIIRGSRDTEITAEAISQARQAMPEAEYVELPGIGHGAVIEAMQRVNDLIVGFLKS
ncbi:MAG: alpha/beta fold hydrolase [SAR324 cluster bacterium]|nr:alpha/beta fold hydrolase [SAR324 cluster bacterium]